VYVAQNHSLARIGDFLGVSSEALLAYANRLAIRKGRIKATSETTKDAAKYRLLTLAAPPAELAEAYEENELYAKWREASEVEKQELEKPLFNAIRKHASAVIWNSLREYNPELAYTVASDVIASLSKFGHRSKFSTWVQGIAKKKINEYLRKTTRRRRVFDDRADYEKELEKEVPSKTFAKLSSFETLDDLNARFLLNDLKKGLKAQDRVLLDNMLEGRDTAELAEKLGISLDAAESRCRRLRMKLKKIILGA
jgi:RNA polymerase sigma factor (sigma-70 family)